MTATKVTGPVIPREGPPARFDLPDVGEVYVTYPYREIFAEVDRVWPPLRKATDLHRWWRWEAIMLDRKERCAVLDINGKALSLWASKKTRLLKLKSGNFFRLDYLEAHPGYRGGTVGLFSFLLVAARALELGADGIVLGALPVDGVTKFYETLSGTPGPVPGWQAEQGLLPFSFDKDTLIELKKKLDEYRFKPLEGEVIG